MQTAAEHWLYRPNRMRNPRLRLFCFPYSGSTAALFRTWPSNFREDVEVIAIELPGRAWRRSEPAITSLLEASMQTVRVIAPLLDSPFMLYGHSVGGLLAYEVARELRESRLPLPVRMLASGRRPPQHEPTGDMHQLPETELFAAVARLGGTVSGVLEDPEMRRAIAPVLRADLTMSDTYRHLPQPALPTPFSIFTGDCDPLVPLTSIEDWKLLTTAECDFHVLPGGHFFIQGNSRPQFMRKLADTVHSALAPQDSGAPLPLKT